MGRKNLGQVPRWQPAVAQQASRLSACEVHKVLYQRIPPVASDVLRHTRTVRKDAPGLQRIRAAFEFQFPAAVGDILNGIKRKGGAMDCIIDRATFEAATDDGEVLTSGRIEVEIKSPRRDDVGRKEGRRTGPLAMRWAGGYHIRRSITSMHLSTIAILARRFQCYFNVKIIGGSLSGGLKLM